MGASNYYENEAEKHLGAPEVARALDREISRAVQAATRVMENEMATAARAVILRRVRKMAEEIPLSITIRGHGAK